MLIYRVIIGILECINHSSQCTRSTLLLLTGRLKEEMDFFFLFLPPSSLQQEASHDSKKKKKKMYICAITVLLPCGADLVRNAC